MRRRPYEMSENGNKETHKDRHFRSHLLTPLCCAAARITIAVPSLLFPAGNSYRHSSDKSEFVFCK